jgi:hypothetical protein
MNVLDFWMKLAALFVASGLLSASLQAESLLDSGYRDMYNLQFDAAHAAFAEYQRENPNDPLGAASDAAAFLFSEFDRLHVLRSEFALKDENFFSASKPLAASPAAKQSFEAALAKTKDLAEAGLEQSPPDPNSMLATTFRLGLHADYLALVEKRELPALSEIKQARTLADKLLSTHPSYYDAWIAAALENYLLSLKAAPVRWFLHATGAQTDRQTGLEKLRVTAEKGHYLAPYARLLLAVAALRDHHPNQAKQLLAGLAQQFPENHLYKDELAHIR